MLRNTLVTCFACFLLIPQAMAGGNAATAGTQLTAAQIAEKNVSARGGLQAWRAVKTMSMSGKMDAGGTQNVQLPFVLEKKRPRKTRLEIQFAGQTAVQTYDGVAGWKLRPFMGRKTVEPFTAEELGLAAAEAELDGPLVDYAAKGTRVELEGTEIVEKHPAYKLKLTFKSGQIQHIWVDTETFLEVKIEGVPRRLDGRYHPVEIYLRDYKSVNGLKFPYVLETSVVGLKMPHKMTLESVVVNPKLEDSLFAVPKIQ